jgi:hypothetical protein
MAGLGLCDDLRAAGLGTALQGHAELKGVLTCDYGFGVDIVAFWGKVVAGYPELAPTSPTASVNGQDLAALNVQLSGSQAVSLFQALPTSPSDPTKSSSPTGRVTCEKLSGTAAVFCQISGVVGLSIGDT